jgi:hypothetical protein
MGESVTDSLIVAANVFGPPLVGLTLLVGVACLCIVWLSGEIENGRRNMK